MASVTLSTGKKVLVGSKAYKKAIADGTFAEPKKKDTPLAGVLPRNDAQAAGGLGSGIAPENTDPNATENIVRQPGETDAKYAARLRGSNIYSGPTVISSAGIIEQKIPQINAKANALPIYGGDSTFGSVDENDSGSLGTDYDIDSILGLDSKKKKKKDAWENMRARQNAPRTPSPEDDPSIRASMALIKQMQQTSDKRTALDMARIGSQFDRLVADQESANASGLAGIKQALNLGGSSRYAPISSQGTVNMAVTAGIRAVADLNMKEQEVVSEIRRAQEDNDYQLLSEKLNLLESVRQEKATATGKLQGTIRDQEQQSSRDNAIAGLVGQGITNPVQMLNMLNYDEAGNQIGDFTIKEITDAMSSLNDVGTGGGSFKFDPKQIGPLLGAGFSISDINQMQADFNAGQSIEAVLQGVPAEMQETVRNALGVPTNVGNIRPGVGATDAITEQMIRTRLFPKAATILNKGTLSDTDRQVIDERISFFRDNGLSEQQILDVFSGWSSDINTPFNNSFREILLSNQKDGEGMSQDLTSVGSLLAGGKYQSAMNKVENGALDKIKDQDGYMGKIPVEVYTKRIDRIKQLLKQGGVVGFVPGNFQKMLGRIKGSDAARIKAELTQLYNTFRKENSGVAVTPSEEGFLNNLFADINDTKGNFMEKIDVFQSGILDGHNASRATVSLPRVRVLDILDPNERLRLYAEQVTSDTSNSADI